MVVNQALKGYAIDICVAFCLFEHTRYIEFMNTTKNLHIGTCSWKYPSWKGLVYSKAKPKNFLEEYSAKYSTVEVDQWFWSLFGDSVVLPKKSVVEEYAASVPDSFKFGIKVPNSIMLTHHYKKGSRGPLIPNEHFLSVDLMKRFLESIEPLHSKLGPLMFQFGYLNKQKMRDQSEFLDRFGEFVGNLPKGLLYAVETRNPNYLNDRYFKFLDSFDLVHVFVQGYYMPSIFEIFAKYKALVRSAIVIRLHGPDRTGIEEVTGKKWDEIVQPMDDDISRLDNMLSELEANVFIFVNNHFEGSAPRTISKISERITR